MICLQRRHKVQRRRQLGRPYSSISELLLKFRETALTPRIEPAEPVRMEQLSGPGGGNGTQATILGA